MIKAPISLQDLRRSLYIKAKAEPAWRFWGLYVHVCKMEMLYEAYQMAKSNDGAPGIDGVTFEAIEESRLGGDDCRAEGRWVRRNFSNRRPQSGADGEEAADGGKCEGGPVGTTYRMS
jgi:RNA-directed DNA polymerase